LRPNLEHEPPATPIGDGIRRFVAWYRDYSARRRAWPWNKFVPTPLIGHSPQWEHPMRIYSLAVTAAALIVFPFAAAAANQSTDMSSQVRVETGPGGVAVGVGRGRGRGRGCKTVTVRERLPGGRVKITKRRECRRD
jgi:hypothetical protein